MKCETPAFASGSSRAPAPIQKPSETERTLVSRSVISRSPESSSERTYSCTAQMVLLADSFQAMTEAVAVGRADE